MKIVLSSVAFLVGLMVAAVAAAAQSSDHSESDGRLPVNLTTPDSVGF